MINLDQEVNNYISPKKPPRPLEVEFAGEVYGCDPAISELTVPNVVIYIPKSFIKKYNLAKTGKNSEKLPNPDELWQFLHPHLRGKGLTAPNEYERMVSVDNVIEELFRWPYGARYEHSSNTRKGSAFRC